VVGCEWRHISNDYKLIRVLGKGAFGMVVKARDRKTKEVVAIKMMTISKSQQILAMALREIQILKQLSKLDKHNVTCKLRNVVLSPERSKSDQLIIFLIMDYFPLSLESFIHNSVKIEYSEA